MIKLRKLMPSEILAIQEKLARIRKYGREEGIERNKEIVDSVPKLYKEIKNKPSWLSGIEEIIERDNVIYNKFGDAINVVDNFIDENEKEITYSIVDEHLINCENCLNGEYCENLGGILAA